MDTKTVVQTTSAAAESNINIGIDAENRSAVVGILSHLLADEHILYIKLRNYHWNIQGMSFVALHSLFEEQYDSIAETIDDVAERIRSLGAFSPGSMQEFKALSLLEETDHLDGNDKKMLENILADYEAIIQMLRINVEKTMNQYKDAGTSDFLTGIMEDHEKKAWMIRAHLS